MKSKRDPLCFLLFLLGMAFAVFQITPSFLAGVFRKPMTWGDMLDFLTPFAVIPIVCFLYINLSQTELSHYNPFRFQRFMGKFLLMVGSLMYVDGHGMHLSSNSVARLLHGSEGSELFRAIYLFDEIISHFIWHGGIFLISLGLIILAWGVPVKTPYKGYLVLLIIGACFYGFSFTVIGIEGQTVIFVLPAAGVGFLSSLFLYLRQEKKNELNPVMLFFTAAYFLSILLFAYWGIVHSRFPQFSEKGWI